jgi:7-keto-8-aminopelargonate synthetase-like enzyme
MSEPAPLQQINRTRIRSEGRVLSFFGGCDFFRLSTHPKILAAVKQGMARYGLNVASSRRTTGNHQLYLDLEAVLAKFFGAESALAVSTGYAGSIVAAQALAGEFSHALVDERAHVALSEAATALNCPVFKFKHRDADDLARAVKRCGHGARPMVLTDGMFGHDGSIAPLRAYLQALPRDGWLLVDDAYGAGTLGQHGRGTLEFAGVSRARVIQCVTLSKAFGVFGGAVLGPRKLREKIFARSAMFIGSTPLPLPLANGALAAVKLLSHSNAYRQRLQQNTARARNVLSQAGLSLPATPGPIITLPTLSPAATRRLTRALLAAEIFPSLLKYPGGSAEGYFRFVISSEHSRRQLDSLVRVLAGLVAE